MITSQSFFTDTFNVVDRVIAHYVQMAYSHLLQGNQSLITALFTFYVMVQGYRFLTHTAGSNLANLMRQSIIMLCVYGLVMYWSLYNQFVYNIFTNEPGYIAKVFISSTGQMASPDSIVDALNTLFQDIITTCMGFFSHGSFSSTGLAFLCYGILVFCISMPMCIFALLLFLYAKIAMAIGLALGPVFILCILWDATKNLCSAWLSQLMTFALIPIITSSILALMLSVIQVTLPQINIPIEQQQFTGIAPFLCLSLVTALLLIQVIPISSALGGGITLASLSRGLDFAKVSLEKSGLTQFTQQTSQRFLHSAMASRRVFPKRMFKE